MTMNIARSLAICALALNGAAFAAGDHADEAKPRHGGVVTVVKDVRYELVAARDVLAIHVSDHGKPVDVSGATAKLTLLSGSVKQDVALKASGPALEARGSFETGPGTKAVAQVALKSKPVQSVRFTLK